MISTNVQEPSFIKSFLASVLVHGLVILSVLFLAKPKPLPHVETMQASLVGGDGLADIQGQIAQAHAKYQAKNQINTDSTPTPTTTPTPHHDYQDDFAKREQAYQAQMQAYAEALDQEIASELHAYREALSAEETERQRQVKELEQRERSNDEIARENAKELSKAREQKAPTQQAKTANTDNPSDGTPNTPTLGQGGQIGGDTSGGVHSTGNGTSQADVIAALQAHIKRHWQPLGTNAQMNVRLKVDAQGNVQSVQVTGGTDALQNALEDTIRRASPLTPIEGTSYRNLNFKFTIN